MTEYEAAMLDFQAATLATRYAALALSALQCVILSYGLWRLHWQQTAFERKLDMAERRHAEAMKALDRGMKAGAESRADAIKTSTERHEEAMKASAERHAEAMRSLEALIERTAPKDRE